MKRTLMMLVAMLALAAVASVQAADVKVEIKERDANNNLVPAQNIKYSVSNDDGEIVASGDACNFSMDVVAGNYELTVEQAATARVRYGAAALVVTEKGDNFVFELTDAGLKKERGSVVIPSQPVANASLRPVANLPQVPTQTPIQVPTGATMYSGNNWGFLGLAGALVATAIALGVDDDKCPCAVTPCQR